MLSRENEAVQTEMALNINAFASMCVQKILLLCVSFLIAVNGILVSASSNSNSQDVLPDAPFCTHIQCVEKIREAAEISISRLTAASVHENTAEQRGGLNSEKLFPDYKYRLSGFLFLFLLLWSLFPGSSE